MWALDKHHWQYIPPDQVPISKNPQYQSTTQQLVAKSYTHLPMPPPTPTTFYSTSKPLHPPPNLKQTFVPQSPFYFQISQTNGEIWLKIKIINASQTCDRKMVYFISSFDALKLRCKHDMINISYLLFLS